MGSPTPSSGTAMPSRCSTSPDTAPTPSRCRRMTPDATEPCTAKAARASGRAQRVVVVAGTEHISVLYSDRTHAEATTWLNASLGGRPDGRRPRAAVWLAADRGGQLRGRLFPGAGPHPGRRRIPRQPSGLGGFLVLDFAVVRGERGGGARPLRTHQRRAGGRTVVAAAGRRAVLRRVSARRGARVAWTDRAPRR